MHSWGVTNSRFKNIVIRFNTFDLEEKVEIQSEKFIEIHIFRLAMSSI